MGRPKSETTRTKTRAQMLREGGRKTNYNAIDPRAMKAGERKMIVFKVSSRLYDSEGDLIAATDRYPKMELGRAAQWLKTQIGMNTRDSITIEYDPERFVMGPKDRDVMLYNTLQDVKGMLSERDAKIKERRNRKKL